MKQKLKPELRLKTGLIKARITYILYFSNIELVAGMPMGTERILPRTGMDPSSLIAFFAGICYIISKIIIKRERINL